MSAAFTHATASTTTTCSWVRWSWLAELCYGIIKPVPFRHHMNQAVGGGSSYTAPPPATATTTHSTSALLCYQLANLSQAPLTVTRGPLGSTLCPGGVLVMAC